MRCDVTKKKPSSRHVCSGPNCDHTTRGKGSWMRLRTPDALDRETEDMLPVPEEQQLSQLANRLLGFGLKPWEVEVLIQKDVLSMRLVDIAEQGGYTSSNAVYKIYKLALKKARQAYEGLTDG